MVPQDRPLLWYPCKPNHVAEPPNVPKIIAQHQYPKRENIGRLGPIVLDVLQVQVQDKGPILQSPFKKVRASTRKGHGLAPYEPPQRF